MTSPEPLPLIPPGTIWDGVTEYRNDLPPGFSTYFACRMYGDRTRRFSEFGNLSHNVMDTLRRKTAEGWESIGVSAEYPGSRKGLFLHYDGTVSNDPANQYFDLDAYREHAARFAHQLDDAMGHHSLTSMSEEDRLVILQTLSAMLGSAERRYRIWDAVDPLELVIGGNFDGVPLWKRTRPEYAQIDQTLCSDCDVVTYARRFRFKANLPLFRSLYRSGIIYSVDRSLTPWGAQLFDVASQPESQFYDNLEFLYHELLEHYDTVVGAQDHA